MRKPLDHAVQPDGDFTMQEPGQTTGLDHTSDPNFLAFYERKSASPQLRAHFLRIRDKAREMLAAQMPGQQQYKVLDIGCNAGTQARVWAELGHDVYGLDVNGPLLEVARARALAAGVDIQFDLGTATALPYADESMDVCIMLELLEHVQDWESCVKEAVRVVRPGGLLYLSTTNALCPKQQEYYLPMYSWYPAPLKRYYERLAVTTRPELVNHARYPAVHWFTYYELRDYLAAMGMRSLDRFDLIDTRGQGAVVKAAMWALRAIPPLRFVGHVLTNGTAVMAVKDPGRHPA
jgi:2-polyprenyl-6-hydroxyphenyl methylase/3-demethylubiquinone-9 3-methyltransferase